MSDTPIVSLADVIAWVESKNDCSALRFEPANWERLSEGATHSQNAILALIASANTCSHGTARMIYSTSWGKYQIMGFNLYGPEIRCTRRVLEWCADDDAQFEGFHTLAGAMDIDQYTPEQLAANRVLREHFGLIWNGSRAYAEPLADALAHFHFAVK